MKRKLKLSAEDRNFFSLVSKAAFSNPFSEDRIALDLEISGLSLRQTPQKRLDAVLQKVVIKVKRFEKEKKANVTFFHEEDSLLVKHTLLFYIFHLCMDDFDQLILDQIKAGDKPCKVSFFQKTVSLMKKYGFSNIECSRYFAIFYQMRRAFFFIETRLIGNSACMWKLRLDLWNNVFTQDINLYEKYLWNRMEDFSTLLLGETGSGKGAAASAIGCSGFIPFSEKVLSFEESFTSSFVSLNLSQFSESLIESELFGHRKGAFTGAVDDHKGVFERSCPHGSIFLDEIGDVSIPVQIKLLKILQERIFSPVGSHKKLRFQGRVIAATNQDISILRSRGKFRDDFFYRLCSDMITVPSLRQRLQEDPIERDELLGHTIKRIVGSSSLELVEIVKETIDNDLGKNYAWPGNVRELEQCVRRVLLKKSYIGDRVKSDSRKEFIKKIETGSLDANALLKEYCMLLYNRYKTYEEVARKTKLDRRTVKKYILLD